MVENPLNQMYLSETSSWYLSDCIIVVCNRAAYNCTAYLTIDQTTHDIESAFIFIFSKKEKKTVI